MDRREGSNNTDDEIDNSNNDTNDTKTLDHKKVIMLDIIACATTKVKIGSSKKKGGTNKKKQYKQKFCEPDYISNSPTSKQRPQARKKNCVKKDVIKTFYRNYNTVTDME